MLKSIKAMFVKPTWIFVIFGLVNCSIIVYYFLNVGIPAWGILQFAVALVAGPLSILFGILIPQKRK